MESLIHNTGTVHHETTYSSIGIAFVDRWTVGTPLALQFMIESKFSCIFPIMFQKNYCPS